MSKWPNPGGVEFLHTELQTGLSFANLALSAKPDEKDQREKDIHNARKAYDTFLKFRERVLPDASDSQALASNAELLKAALRSLGESV